MKNLKNCKKYVFGTCVVLIAIFILSIITFNEFAITSNKSLNDKNNAIDNVEPLATAKIYSPTIHTGTMKFFSAASNATTRTYSQLTTAETASSIKATMAQTSSNTLTMNTTASNKNSKNAYFDFYTRLIVPALTEYKVTYTITYTIKKVASNGNAGVYAKLYDYGRVANFNGVSGNWRCAESLYNAGTDLEFNLSTTDTNNAYWVGDRISSTSYNKLLTGTFSKTITYTNKEEYDVAYRNYYGYYGFIASATGYASRMQSTVSVATSITAKLLAVPKPTDVNTQYTGQSLSLADIASSQKTWYDANIMDIDYSENQDMVNVGTKRVKATIKPDMRNDENKFSGEIGEGEEEYVRYFNFVIDKKQIGLDVGLNTNGQPVWQFKSGAVYGEDTAENGRAPNIGFTYSSIDGKDYNSDVYPNAVGKYKATAKILNDCSYELDGKYEVEFSVDKREVAKPDVSGQRSVVYSGNVIEFSLSNVTDDVNITPPEGMDCLDGKLTAKNVGVYTVAVSLKDYGSATKWANSSGDIAPYTFDVEITQATLNLTTTCSASDWIWQAGDAVEVSIVGDSFENDVTELRIFYKDSKDQEYDYINGEEYKQVEGKKRIVTMPTNIPIGNYTLHIELYGNRVDNANYKLAPTSIPFTILGNDIEFNESNLRWRYNGALVEDPSQVLELIYADSTYKFDVDTSNLQSLGVRIDTEKGINGLEGDISATNVNGGRLYSVKVYIVNYDSSYKEYNAIFTLTYRINKAAYDLNELSWEYSEPLPYKTSPQSVTLSGALPKGLTVTYSGNGQIPVGNYTTSATFNVADVDNYYIPSIVDSGTYIYDGGAFPFSIDWEITKATLTCNWKPGEDLGSGIYKLPTLSTSAGLNLDTMVTYKYYDDDGNEVNLADIDVNKENRYKAVATLTDSYVTNYQLANHEYTFVIGQNRYPVRLIVDIADMQVPYKGSPYEANVKIAESQGGVTLSHVELKYFEKDTNQELTGAPVKVGEYRVEASLTFGLDEFNYIEDNTFEFEIVKADFDASSLVWQYKHTDKNGSVFVATYDFEQGKWLSADGTEAKDFVYDGNAHLVELIGKDEINALLINYKGENDESIDEISEINAGVYDIMLEFVFDEESYNYPDVVPMITFLIEQAEIDTSQIVWGYTDENGEDIQYTQPFVFTRKDGIDVEFTLKLINLPEQLVDAISYGGTSAASNAGIYTAEYTLDFYNANYKPVEMSELLESRRWEIKQRVINKPVKNDSWTVFDGKEHSLAQVFSIDEEGWENYLSIITSYNGENFDGHIAINAGDYIVSFALVNAGTNNANLNWLERPLSFNLLEVAQLELNVTEWDGSGETSKVLLDNEDYAVFLDYRFLDKDGVEVTAENLLPNVVYYKEVIVKNEYSANVKISQHSLSKISFSFSDGRTKVDKPTFEKLQLTYDGKTHTVEDFGMSAIENFIQVDLPSEMKNAGDYKVSFKFKYNGLYCWDDGSDGVYEVTLTIRKAQLPPEWNTDGDTPTFVIPEGFAGLVDVEYTYFDGDGNEIILEDMRGGESYKVVAKLSEQYAGNFEFVDADGVVLPEATESEEKTFEKSETDEPPISSGDNGGGSEALEEFLAKLKEMPFWQIIVSAAGIVLSVIFFVKAASYDEKRRKAKKLKQSKYSSYYAAVFLGMSAGNWTVIACVIIGLVAISIAAMIISKVRYGKAQEELDTAKDEFEQEQAKKKEDDMRMMLMGIMGANAAGGGGQNAAIDMGAIRGMIDDAMEHNMQQLPEPISNANDELVQRLLEENARSQEAIRELMQQLSAQQPVERVVAREVAAANADDETIKSLIEGQKEIMQKLNELSKKQNVEPQIIEKVVEKEVKVEVPVEVEKIIEKEVIKEVPVERVVEKVVEREMPVETPIVASKQKKETASRLTLDDAYAKLSKQQQKYFDGLREYALSKDEKCKEKPSTYFTTIGTSTVNPLIKLTIKKNITVAMFKMEDEYMKDIRRNATSDGAKIKVKETELIVADAQAFKAAKEMIDLREDQIERYQDLLKEQRSMKKK